MQTKRRYFGEKTAAPLVRFLNAGGKEAALLEQLLEAARRLEDSTEPVSRQAEDRMLAKLAVPGPVRKDIRKMQTVDRAKPGRSRDRAKALFDINRVLRRVSLSSVLVATLRDKWLISWSGAGVAGSAADALFRLLALGEDGLLKQVRRCARPKCKQWFFAGRPQRRFCSKGCQEAVYEATPERKEARRQYARQFYKEAR